MIRPLHAPGTVRRTIWGLTPEQVHQRYWAWQNIQIVRPRETISISQPALYLLLEHDDWAVFDASPAARRLARVDLDLLIVRLRRRERTPYRERVWADDDASRVHVRRQYPASRVRHQRVAITPHRWVAALWQEYGGQREGWRAISRAIPRPRRRTIALPGSVHDASSDQSADAFMQQLLRVWDQPHTVIERTTHLAEGIFTDPNASWHDGTRFVGPIWIGAGRHLNGTSSVVGPAVLWDDPDALAAQPASNGHARPPAPELAGPIQPAASPQAAPCPGKRAFDIAFAAAALAVTLPTLFPLIMLAIWLEDGRPFIFGHWRQTRGGRAFKCLKFRSMRKDAEHLKSRLVSRNLADGPQFYVRNDPRLTRVGRALRTLNLDELPQFWNVLKGEMSVVGPRPSPDNENQFCPAWRETRLSVRPGITGLWQISRSRSAGLDFQEWIRYDIQYVENQSWRLDLWILWRTVLHMLGLKRRGQ